MEIITVILLMMLVTYLPRMIPMYFIKVEKIPSELKRFFSFIPYAALGALILPGSISAISGKPEVSALAIAVSAVIAWFNSSIIVTVFLTVAATYLLLLSGL
jgi:branched-subunit amino acid transport protein